MRRPPRSTASSPGSSRCCSRCAGGPAARDWKARTAPRRSSARRRARGTWQIGELERLRAAAAHVRRHVGRGPARLPPRDAADLDRGTAQLRPLLAGLVARRPGPDRAADRTERGDNLAGCAASCSPTGTATGRAGSRIGWQRPGTVFIAVGAGHLAGPGSVIDDLSARRDQGRAGAARDHPRGARLSRAPACFGGRASPIGAPPPLMVIPGGVSGSIFLNPQLGDMQ